jgi:hypothetical protein
MSYDLRSAVHPGAQSSRLEARSHQHWLVN